MSHSGQDRTPLQAVLELYAALRDSSLSGLTALTTPDVVCQPLVRPGLSIHHGHYGMTTLSRDIHAACGDYAVTIISATEQPGPQVTIRARIDPQPGHGTPYHVRTVCTFRDGLIAAVISTPDASEPGTPQAPA